VFADIASSVEVMCSAMEVWWMCAGGSIETSLRQAAVLVQGTDLRELAFNVACSRACYKTGQNN
jgi:hypothetical protein